MPDLRDARSDPVFLFSWLPAFELPDSVQPPCSPAQVSHPQHSSLYLSPSPLCSWQIFIKQHSLLGRNYAERHFPGLWVPRGQKQARHAEEHIEEVAEEMIPQHVTARCLHSGSSLDKDFWKPGMTWIPWGDTMLNNVDHQVRTLFSFQFVLMPYDYV